MTEETPLSREILQEVDAELEVAALCKMQTGRALARLSELQTAADPKVRSEATETLNSTVPTSGASPGP